MTVMIIQGKVENVFDNEDFAQMLREKLGSDAEQYFREQTDPEAVLEDYDTGESHYLNLLDEIEEELKEIMRESARTGSWSGGSAHSGTRCGRN